MNESLWSAFLDTLTPSDRNLAQKIMARIQTVLNSDRLHTLDEAQRVARRTDRNAERLEELAIRLDAYEEQRALDVAAELERFARDQLPPDERDKLIGVLYNVVTRIERLEDDERTSGAA
jgi:hypothetical protein